MHQGTSEWIEWRKTKVGASDAPCIMGEGYKTPYQLWEEKKGLRCFKPNWRMQRGKDLEEHVRRWFELETGLVMWPCVEVHHEHDWMVASLDGLDDDGNYGLEIKVTTKENVDKVRVGSVPDHWYPQVQHQIAVKPSRVYFAAHCPETDDYAYCVVERDDEYIARMFDAEREFYRCLIDDVPPELTDRDCVYEQRDDVEFGERVAKWRAAHEHYVFQKELYEHAKAERDAAKDALVAICDNTSCQGSGVRVRKTPVKGRVHYEKIPELQHIDLAHYRGPATIRWTVKETDYGC